MATTTSLWIRTTQAVITAASRSDDPLKDNEHRNGSFVERSHRVVAGDHAAWHGEFGARRVDIACGRQICVSIVSCARRHGEARSCRCSLREPRLETSGDIIPLIRLQVDSKGTPTQQYPSNPNGSPNAIAGVSSADGRHFCLM